jgi:hypothetical protein
VSNEVSERVFLGIVTCGRDDYLRQVMEGVEEHLMDVVDEVVIFHDGPPSPTFESIAAGYGIRGLCTWAWSKERRGVGRSKNELLRAGLYHECDHLFVMEDDVVPQSSEAITGYLAAAEASNWQHLAFAHHGPANDKGPVENDASGLVTIWPAYVGAFCLYSRLSIETCGLFDEAFVNSWDHVEHTLRLSLAGFHPLPPEPYELRAADATGSEMWLKEIEGSIQNTSISHTEEWKANRLRGRLHWKATYPETYRLLFSR